jgi:hypothetical protein
LEASDFAAGTALERSDFDSTRRLEGGTEMRRECWGDAERLSEIGEEGVRRAHRMGTIHRRRIDLRRELLVVADACCDIGGRGWVSKLVVEEFGRLSSKNALAVVPLTTPSAAAAEIMARAISTADSWL